MYDAALLNELLSQILWSAQTISKRFAPITIMDPRNWTVKRVENKSQESHAQKLQCHVQNRDGQSAP